MASVPRFHCPGLAAHETVSLPPEEAHHARSVLRLGTGSEIIVFDGNGSEATGRIERLSRHEALVRVGDVRVRPFELSIRLTLAVAMPRSHRQHVLIEKCTELGVFAVQPLISERSVVLPSGNSVEKWSRMALEAAKQSGRSWVPRILPPASFADVVAQIEPADLAVVLDPTAEPALTDMLSGSPDLGTMTAWVGPEGGFTEQEQQLARDYGARRARLGPTVLRIETAAMLVAGLVATRSRGPASAGEGKRER
jgi:16S rRNA (uracil1498-N3)-methyltransferase